MRKPTGTLVKFADAKKQGGKLLPAVERYLLKQHLAGEDDLERREDVIHPSEMAKSDWCPRATYYRIIWTRDGIPLPPDEKWRFQRENIFYEGDRIHEKWQSTFYAMGVLWGRWKCLHCTTYFWAQSPETCEKCGSTALRYAEVPMQSRAHMIGGQSDGEHRSDEGIRLIEIKSVGDGTVRVESPTLFRQYTHKVTDEEGNDRTYFDMRGLFRDLKKPFPSHLRQGWIYLFLRALMTEQSGWPECDGIAFIYEAKSTQAVKEFYVRRNDEFIVELLDTCRDIVYALENGRPPSCKEGRRSKGCKECLPFTEPAKDRRDNEGTPEDDADSAPTATEHAPGPRTRADRRRGASNEAKSRSSGAADRGVTYVARRTGRRDGHATDQPDGGVHTLGGLLADASRSRGDRRVRR